MEILSIVKELEDVVKEQKKKQEEEEDCADDPDDAPSVPLPFTSVPLMGEHRLIYTDT